MKKVIALLLLLLCGGVDTEACTTFCLQRGPAGVFGKNYDWHIGDGLVVVNKQGVEKRSILRPAENPARWTSKYGSVTFNQYGREFPSGGMNEKGLVVELMWLDATRYPPPDGRPALNCLEWIQYQLDTSDSVQAVLANAAKLRIASEAGLHYLVCERSGRCATVEFLNGKLVQHSGKTLPVPVLANSTYAESLDFLKRQGAKAQGTSSLSRFARASKMIQDYPGGGGTGPVQYAFNVLDRVAQAHTQWSIVYDQRGGRVHWKTRSNPRPRWIDFAALDFSCSTPVRILDIDDKAQGDVTRHLAGYRPEKNRALVVRAMKGTPFLANTPAEEMEATARHPERSSCARR